MDTEKTVTDEIREEELQTRETPLEPDAAAEVPEAVTDVPAQDVPFTADKNPIPVQENPVPPQDVPTPAEEVPAPAAEKVKKPFIRTCASWTDIFPIAAMLSVIITVFGSILSTLLDRSIIPAEQIGMKVFLLTDTMINKKNVDLTPYPHGDFAVLQNYLEEIFRQ